MKIFSFKVLIAFIITILTLYSVYWIFLSTQVRSKINNLSNQSNLISYDSIEIVGFPYRMEAQINNLIINDITQDSGFKAFSALIKVDINPINLNKFLIRTKNITSQIYIEDIFFDVSMEEVRSAITTIDSRISGIIIAISKSNIKLNSLKLDEIKKIYFKQEVTEDLNGSINFSAEGTDLIASSSGGMKLELNGDYTFDKAKINGDLQFEILDLNNDEKLFSAPIKIKDNIASFLFIPFLDLNELFNSF